jgi:predicted ATPase
MRLDWIKVQRFKNLVDFEADFDEESMTTVVIGQNGCGKSNLIEALVIIFRDLDLGSPPSFKYSLRYICRGSSVEIDADPNRNSRKTRIIVDGVALKTRQITSGERPFLPSNVFGYYSGPSNRLESHFDKHQERFYKELLKGNDSAPRPLFYARQIHSQFVLLSFFSHQDEQAKDFLRDKLGILGLESVLFVMRQPPWKSKGGDARFWNSRGVVQLFLDRLYAASLAPIRSKERVNLGLRKTSNLEHLYLFIKDLRALTNLSSAYANQRDFFKTLESTYISELISEVRIRVKVQNVDGSLTFRELAEGEQQLLMVLGLLRFTRQEESLFLLDEPDTHLNPVWSIEYLQYLSDLVGREESSHIVMTTHDPLVFSGLERSQVQILKRAPDSGLIYAEIPETDPKGMGVSAILTSEMFGLRSTLDIPTLKLLERKRWLTAQETLTDQEAAELESITEEIGAIDFSSTVRDPLYSQFVSAMAAFQDGLESPALTDEQRERQKEVAMQVLKELKSGEGIK